MLRRRSAERRPAAPVAGLGGGLGSIFGGGAVPGIGPVAGDGLDPVILGAVAGWTVVEGLVLRVVAKFATVWRGQSETSGPRDHATTELLDLAAKMRIDMDRDEAKRWIVAMSAESWGSVTDDLSSGVYGHRVAMADHRVSRSWAGRMNATKRGCRPPSPAHGWAPVRGDVRGQTSLSGPSSGPQWILSHVSHASPGCTRRTRLRHMRRFTQNPVCGTTTIVVVGA
jgi:hypothetical protein